MNNISELPIMFMIVCLVVALASIFLRISGALLILGALVGDFIASRLNYLMPTVSVAGQDISGLILFVTPIVVIVIVARRRHIKMALFDHVLRVLGAIITVLLAMKYSYSLSESTNSSLVQQYSHQLDIATSVILVISLVLVALSLHKGVKHHKK